MVYKISCPIDSAIKELREGDLVVCIYSTRVFQDQACLKSSQELSEIHPSCTGIMLEDLHESSLYAKVYFGEQMFGRPFQSCVIPYDIFQFLLSDRISSDFCLYFDSIVDNKVLTQIQLFEDTSNLCSNFNIKFNEKTWTFDVYSKYEHYLRLKNYHTEQGKKFPEIVEYFEPILSQKLTQTVNYFQFNYTDRPNNI